mgnify:CR=1 FL=1
MALDHEAIYSAYAGTVVSIDDGKGAFDKDGKSVTIDAVKVAAARKALDDAAAQTDYEERLDAAKNSPAAKKMEADRIKKARDAFKKTYTRREHYDWRETLDEKCWKGYEKKGMKTMFGKRYPNCVKKSKKKK